MNFEETKRALVVSYTELETDPRLQKQITWLAEDGWEVDTLGYGAVPHPSVRKHFEVRKKPREPWNSLASLLARLFTSQKTAFRATVLWRVPLKELYQEIELSGYDLVHINDIDLLPWVPELHAKTSGAPRPSHYHLDIHEYHDWSPPVNLPRWLGHRLKVNHEWIRRFIGWTGFDSRSTVADVIAERYSTEFGFEKPAVIRNSREFHNLTPSAVDPNRIELVYHGNSDLSRGLAELITALEWLDDRFHLNFLLTGKPEAISEVKKLSKAYSERITFHPAVPMLSVPERLNVFDIALIYFPPTNENFRLSLPNKFFESIQARLMILTGDAPSMSPILHRYGNGITVPSWGAKPLADALNKLTTKQIQELKSRTNECASAINSDTDRATFLHVMTAGFRQA